MALSLPSRRGTPRDSRHERVTGARVTNRNASDGAPESTAEHAAPPNPRLPPEIGGQHAGASVLMVAVPAVSAL